MVHLTEFFNIVPPKIVGGDKHSLTCYGEQARYLDLEKNVCIVFDETTQEIYEISICDEDAATNSVWRSPKYENAYLDELKRKEPSISVAISYANMDVDDVIEEVKKLYESS